MLSTAPTEARELRDRLTHPIIDADGHRAEYRPLVREEFERIGGDAAVQAPDTAGVEKRAAEVLARGAS